MGAAAGAALLNAFMQNYRQSDYSFTPASARDLQLEVLTQERIEFWGEGWGFPNAKRIKPDVIQNYEKALKANPDNALAQQLQEKFNEGMAQAMR